jgi:hypothetical protein
VKLLAACLIAGVLACGRLPAPDPFAIPRSIPSQLGPVPVVVVDSILGADPRLNLLGGFDPSNRIVYLKRSLGKAQKKHTFFHEECHVWSFDSGLRQIIPPPLMDAICDASASQRMASLLNP